MISTKGLSLSISKLPENRQIKVYRYIKREINHIKSTITNNYTYCGIFNTLNNLDLPNPTFDNMIVIPSYATCLIQGIDLKNELIIMIRRAGMYTGMLDNNPKNIRFKNKIINEINSVNNDKLYSEDRDAFTFHLTTKDEMIKYLLLLLN